jgi:hypothetical protein
MTLLEQIHAALVANAGVTALVGAGAAARIFPGIAEQGAERPYVVLTDVTDLPENSLDGGPADRLRQAVVQVDCYAIEYRAAKGLAKACTAVLAALSDPDGLSAVEVDARYGYEDVAKLHRASADFAVSYPAP